MGHKLQEARLSKKKLSLLHANVISFGMRDFIEFQKYFQSNCRMKSEALFTLVGWIFYRVDIRVDFSNTDSVNTPRSGAAWVRQRMKSLYTGAQREQSSQVTRSRRC